MTISNINDFQKYKMVNYHEGWLFDNSVNSPYRVRLLDTNRMIYYAYGDLAYIKEYDYVEEKIIHTDISGNIPFSYSRNIYDGIVKIPNHNYWYVPTRYQDNEIYIYDLSDPDPANWSTVKIFNDLQYDYMSRVVVFASDGSFIIGGNYATNDLHRIDSSDPDPANWTIAPMNIQNTIPDFAYASETNLALSPDNNYLAVDFKHRDLNVDYLYMIDLSTMNVVESTSSAEVSSGYGRWGNIIFSNDGQYIAVVCSNDNLEGNIYAYNDFSSSIVTINSKYNYLKKIKTGIYRSDYYILDFSTFTSPTEIKQTSAHLFQTWETNDKVSGYAYTYEGGFVVHKNFITEDATFNYTGLVNDFKPSQYVEDDNYYYGISDRFVQKFPKNVTERFVETASPEVNNGNYMDASIYGLSISEDKTKLAVAKNGYSSSDPDNEYGLIIYDLVGGMTIDYVYSQGVSVNEVCWLSGKYLAMDIATMSGSLEILDTETQSVVYTFSGTNSSYDIHIDYNSTKGWLVFSYNDGNPIVKVVDVSDPDPANWNTIQQLTAHHTETLTEVVPIISNNGNFLVSIGDDDIYEDFSTIRVWDTTSWTLIKENWGTAFESYLSRFRSYGGAFSSDDDYFFLYYSNGSTRYFYAVDTSDWTTTYKLLSDADEGSHNSFSMMDNDKILIRDNSFTEPYPYDFQIALYQEPPKPAPTVLTGTIQNIQEQI